MNVLIIPEDFVNDQYVLKPLIQTMMAAIGRPTANVRVCQDPRLRGVAQALDWNRLAPIIDRYQGMTDLFLLCVDRDGVPGRVAALDAIERRAVGLLASSRGFFAENAWQEIEIWVLAGHDLPRGWAWAAMRAEVNVKEQYFHRFAESRGLLNHPAQGRKTLAEEAAKRYDRIRQRCPEDVARLHDRLSQWFPGISHSNIRP